MSIPDTITLYQFCPDLHRIIAYREKEDVYAWARRFIESLTDADIDVGVIIIVSLLMMICIERRDWDCFPIVCYANIHALFPVRDQYRSVIRSIGISNWSLRLLLDLHKYAVDALAEKARQTAT